MDTDDHDQLTGLPNRHLLLERLGQAIEESVQSADFLTLVFADVDSFKSINATYGRDLGDELLSAVGRRLGRLLRRSDTLARLEADEFVILCSGLGRLSHAERIAVRIDGAMDEPFALSTVEVEVTASVGIAYVGRGIDVPGHVLEDADGAMSRAKRTGEVDHAVFDLRDRALLPSGVRPGDA